MTTPLAAIPAVNHNDQLERIARHYRDLAPHVKDRETGRMLLLLLEHIRWQQQQRDNGYGASSAS